MTETIVPTGGTRFRNEHGFDSRHAADQKVSDQPIKLLRSTYIAEVSTLGEIPSLGTPRRETRSGPLNQADLHLGAAGRMLTPTMIRVGDGSGRLVTIAEYMRLHPDSTLRPWLERAHSPKVSSWQP